MIGLKTFRALEKLLYKKVRLKPRILDITLPAAGIGGSGEALATVEWPLGLPGNNGLIQMTILNSDKVPPLTPVGLLGDFESVIDL